MRPILPISVLLAAGAALAVPPAMVEETEPNGFTSPMDVGTLGVDGIEIDATLDPTSPTGLDPGDRDGFRFRMEAAGPFAATVDDGRGTPFVLALSRDTPNGAVQVAAVLGPAPLTLAVKALPTGIDHAVGVAALGDGNPLDYTLTLLPEDALPPWSGAPCIGFLPETEPNPAALQATDLGDFTGVLCATGTLSSVAPPSGGDERDIDLYRFRNVLPVPARLTVRADPGQIRVDVQELVFVGTSTFLTHTFGGEAVLEIPTLRPGATYLVQVAGDFGTTPLTYTMHLEPVAAEDENPPEPLEVNRAAVRLGPDPGRHSFRVNARFEPGLGVAFLPGVAFSYRVRGLSESYGEGIMVGDRAGRLRFKAGRGVPGLRRLVFDPFRGVLRMQGKGANLGAGVDPADPSLALEVTIGTLRLAAESEGKFRGKAPTLVVR